MKTSIPGMVFLMLLTALCLIVTPLYYISIIQYAKAENEMMSDALTETVWRTREGNLTGVINIPSQLTTITNSNPIESVTVMAYVSDVDVGFGEKAEVLGVGGARVAHADYCSAYVMAALPICDRSYQRIVIAVHRFENGH